MSTLVALNPDEDFSKRNEVKSPITQPLVEPRPRKPHPLLVVGLGHQSRMGKDVCAHSIIETFGYAHVVKSYKFAKVLKDIAYLLNLTPQEGIYYETPEGSKQRFVKASGYTQSPVEVWTTLGPYLRAYDPDCFVRPLVKKIITDRDIHGTNIAIITDLRYPNEVAALNQFQHFVPVRVVRKGLTPLNTEADHALDDYNGWQYTIQAPEGALLDLEKQIVSVINHELGKLNT